MSPGSLSGCREKVRKVLTRGTVSSRLLAAVAEAGGARWKMLRGVRKQAGAVGSGGCVLS